MSGNYSLDDLLAAELAGREYPDPDLIERLAEQRAHELLHERAVEMLGLARREALDRHGPAWAALIADQAAAEWEVAG
ncbi:hypothetical protein [Intrasporangium calvum]|uniref:Uncharacterized protein n=1 Tax=Intrasporangium calvum (strain ATCC 23552 / DSM 43043 / JCM 3097 / NBRC 12989 / NCIMB 10167 / NRRL B-3866 / 7 KIP) TaxID=710696 RepID=E6S8L6_INTC7|nr:hypothetical protein [Intrasporangium calvum]ADU49178.1 hypothetical protein Intca_2676 [Intrasporangium calvum DSM 43043]